MVGDSKSTVNSPPSLSQVGRFPAEGEEASELGGYASNSSGLVYFDQPGRSDENLKPGYRPRLQPCLIINGTIQQP